ncbi:MAG: serine hydrolase domain-containing protein [Vicinamibacterales bacterium]
MAVHHHLFAAALAALWACVTAASQQSIVRSPESATLEKGVDALFTRGIRPDGPGCAVGVYEGGEVALARRYGLANVEDGRPITSRTTFNLGSLSKPFTALAALMLEQRGRLSLDDDVRRWVPELPDYGAPIRVRDLLEHTSGLRDIGTLMVLSGRQVTTMPDFLGLLESQRALNFQPGARHEYSHSDYLVLGLVLERVTGEPFGAHLERELLEPLGMRGSFIHDTRARAMKDRALGHAVTQEGARLQFPSSVLVGDTNLYASIEDLARWDRNFDEPGVGGPAIIARMLGRPKLATGDTIPYAYGLRLGEYRGLRTVSRGGHEQGMRTEIIRFPDQRFTVATLCNADNLEAGRLAQGVADIYLGRLMRPARSRPEAPAAASASPPELARYAGVYRPLDAPWNLLYLEVRDGVLNEVLFDDERDHMFFGMTPAGDGRFFEIGETGNVGIFTFRTDIGSGPPRLQISWNDGAPEILERVATSALWRPSAAALAEYAGTWFSPDLDASWRLQSREGNLILRRRGQHDLTLRPVGRDQFVRGFGPVVSTRAVQLQFHRDRAGRLTHLTASTPPGEDSVRDLRFDRLAVR